MLLEIVFVKKVAEQKKMIKVAYNRKTLPTTGTLCIV
jgi:hypothetical protein